MMIAALKNEKLPVAGADRFTLTDYIGVQDCLNLMRFAMSPERDLVLAEILRGPFCGLVDDDRFLFPLGAGRSETRVSLWSRVQASDDPEVRREAVFLQSLIGHRFLPPFEFLSQALNGLSPSGQTGWEKLNARLGAPARDPIESLLTLALKFDQAGPASLQLFITRVEAAPVTVKRDLDQPAGCVRVMTVHGAKGLQAPLVILPDTTGSLSSDTDSLFDLDGMLVWSPVKAEDPEPIMTARALRIRKAEEEFRRLLYVALTRAQDRMIVAGAWSGGKQTKTGFKDNSWYGLCLNAMNELGITPDIDGVFRIGGIPALPKRTAVDDAPPAELPSFLFQSVPEELADRRLIAPTGLVPARTPVSHVFGSHQAERMRRGRLVHTLLQYLPDMPTAERRPAGQRWLQFESGLTDGARGEILEAALGVLDSPAASLIFQPGGRAEAAIIGTAPELPPGTLINGRVDRLVVTPEAVLIIDYKTDQPPPQRAQDVSQSYLAQMAAYVSVLRAAYPTRRVEAFLCWTDGPCLMALPEDLLAASLKSDVSLPI
jgi:ATP-dependent helicase/nuclease subunit A